jgi:hypothetical protein
VVLEPLRRETEALKLVETTEGWLTVIVTLAAAITLARQGAPVVLSARNNMSLLK